MNNPKVSIIIPVYNGSNFIKQSIESALAQTYENIEIIVVNDGSTDNGKTAEIVKLFGQKVKYIEKENGGVASALNKGIEESSGEYISWLSHDDLYLPNKIEKEIKVLKKLEDKNTIIFSNFDLIDENGSKITRTAYTKNIKKEELCQGIYPVVRGCVNGCTILIPKLCFKKVGYFNETLKTTNDYEMWIRLFNEFPSYFIEDSIIKYRIHKNQDTNKSPVFVAESNELWKNIINNLTESQIKKWGFDKFNVYMTLYIQMKNSKFVEAAEVAYNKSKKIYEKQEPVISIAMPCYNSEKYIDKAVESILEQTYCNFELLIVDDSSTDSTIKKIKAYAEKDFRIKILKNEFEKGVSGTMNTAIKNARGIYFTRMDSDDISVLDRIEKQYKFLEENNKYGVCSVNISMMDEYGNLYNEAVYQNSKIPHEWTFLWTNPVPNAPCMYRMDIIKSNKIFFSDLATAEDYEFLYKFMTKTKIYMIEEPLYLYRHIKSSLYNSKLEETYKNSLRISKNYFKEIIGETIPEYYENLTCFYNEEHEVIVEDIKEVNKFLVKVASKFKEYFNWSDMEYNIVIYEIPEILERYITFKHGININKEQKNSKMASIKRLARKTFKYIKQRGVLYTIKRIFRKIRWKILKY